MGKDLMLKSENYECFPLDWDTDYFGVKSARVILKGVIAESDQKKILEFCKDFKFVTISNINNLKENNYWIGNKSSAFLADINIQFSKEIMEEPVLDYEQTEIYSSYSCDEKIIDIAKSAFNYSRFFNDPVLPKERARNIYVHWTKCAFGQANKYFLIAKRSGVIVGYILFSIDCEGSYATIELIAVEGKHKRQKVGRSLISGMELFAYRNNIKKIKVGTQVDNILASQFYTSSGFKYVSCGSIYHLWNYSEEGHFNEHMDN